MRLRGSSEKARTAKQRLGQRLLLNLFNLDA
jgi:hypothetical protein